MLALEARVANAVFAAIEPLLPAPRLHPLGCHRPRVADRVCFRGILIRLVTGASWVDIEAILDHQVSDTTLRARRDEWIAADVFDRLRVEALAAFDRIIGLDLTEVAIDASLAKAPTVAKTPAPTRVTGANRAGNGRSRWTVTASRSVGQPDQRTGMTSSSWTPPSTRSWPTVCSSTSRPPTSIVATTSRPYAANSPNAGSPTPPSNAANDPAANDPNRCVSGCAGSSRQPTHDGRTTANCAATPTARPATVTPRCAWPPPSSPSANSSPTATDGPPTDHLPAQVLSGPSRRFVGVGQAQAVGSLR